MINVNMGKAKVIAHEKRRTARAEEFKPHDEVIMKQIPGTDAQAAEAARQAIREKYAAMQVDIDTAATPDELKQILGI
jgi:predicted flap endonuclease-1-like 5' DNA nuclease